jgi:pyrimidine-nucleoside phosphorylase
MSKKLAAGSDAIVLDVKCGNGAFMETEENANELGQIMVDIGKKSGKKTVAVITDMSQPLGKCVGNSIEVIEAIETLKGNGPEDITELSIELATQMLMVGEIETDCIKSKKDMEINSVKAKEGMEIDYIKAKEKVTQILKSGDALMKFGQFIEAQGGNLKVIEDYSLFPQAQQKSEIKATQGGYVSGINAGTIGMASQRSGAGRATKDEQIDLSAGIILNKKVGDRVEASETLATVYSSDQAKLLEAHELTQSAFIIEKDPPTKKDLIINIIK